MNETQHLVAERHRRANQARGPHVLDAFPLAKMLIAGHVLGQDGFARRQNLAADIIGHLDVTPGRRIAMPVSGDLDIAGLVQRKDGAGVGGNGLE